MKMCSKCKTNKNDSDFYIRIRKKVVGGKPTDEYRNPELESWCKNCKIHQNTSKYREYNRLRETKNRKSRKLRIMSHYSNGDIIKCVCCKIDQIVFLTIDHTNNDGAEHRRKIGGGGDRLYKWLERNKYPDGFQVMCFNCNHAKFFNGGICPHKL